MHFRTRTWVIISLLCFMAAAIFWQLAARLERRAKEDAAARGTNAARANPPAGSETGAPRRAAANVVPANAAPALPAAALASAAKTNVTQGTNAAATNPYPHRLSNTAKSLDELLRSEQAVLLRNALIDSTAPLQLAIPPHLRAAGDAGAYVVQARGLIDDAFRARLQAANAEIVAYVPNNGFLVRASAASAQQLAAAPETQAVIAWEPYFKLDPVLLALAVEKKPMPSGALNVVLFPGQRAAAQAEFERLGVTVTSEQPSPFGPHVTVLAPVGKLVELAALPAVQDISRHFARGAANDHTRARLRIATNTIVANNYQNLSGANVLVAVNDFGVEGGHPDLSPRVFGDTVDFNGHGTHVAGVIASSGANGPPGTNVIGSHSNANFRGMAPAASIWSQRIDTFLGFYGPPPTDTALQEGAALTNALIANNSWAYVGDSDYSIASAIWDAGTRDALPGVTGAQPILPVFAAGNGNPIQTALFGSFPGFILSPGTAKNVVTVGASENRRNVTNEVTIDGFTFPVWQSLTDSSNEVAGFSARGNVGVGLEGTSGRFKPDVVAPGTFIVSCRSSLWVDPTAFASVSTFYFPNELVLAGGTNYYTIDIPPDGVALIIEVLPNRFSPSPFPQLGVLALEGAPPQGADFLGFGAGGLPVTPGATVYYQVANDVTFNTPSIDTIYDLRVSILITNATGDYFPVLQTLNTNLGLYRYESGTSQSAAAVSGMLALMQEYFATKLSRTNSPALMKALLINGARTLGGAGSLDFQVAGGANGQGWGLVNITNSAPTPNAVNGGSGAVNGSTIFYDQDASRALVTRQSVTRTISVNGTATNFPLRITLAWTDPPGNPAVGPKLVNDLDLIVTAGTNAIYLGNNFNGAFTTPLPAGTTNLPLDTVNNVENVYIDRRLASTYTVTVRARRVNVNAVTAQTNGIGQDFALVISSGSPSATALAVSDATVSNDTSSAVATLTNGMTLLRQRVGANHPFLASTNGEAKQWRFFTVKNELPPRNGTNQMGSPTHMAFLVFFPPNLSWPRTNTADLDLYVSQNSAITNLDPAAIAGSFRSVGRGGTESVILSNAIPDATYYAAVKSEDQMAGEFGIFVVSSTEPFSSMDTNGNIVAQGYVLPSEIPDGAPDNPQAALVFAFVTEPAVIQNIIVTNEVSHGNLGDLLGVLEHNLVFSTLNNGQGNPPNYPGFIEWIFDDGGTGQLTNSVPTDPPGSLRNFVGEEAAGVWQMTMIDSSQFFTGRVENLVISIEPRSDDLTNGTGIVRTIQPNRFFYTVVDVPADATNLSVCVAPDIGPVEVYVRRGAFPDRQTFDKFGFFGLPGDCLDLGRGDSPPLSAGRYFIGVYNPNSEPVTTRIQVFIERNLLRSSSSVFRSGGTQSIFDDATTNVTSRVFRRQQVSDVRVGVRIDHPRVADLVLSLVSPSGTRAVLSENRGGPDGANFGFGYPMETTVFIPSTGDESQTNINLNLPSPDGTLEITYEMFTLADRVTVYYENEQLYDSGFISGQGTISVEFSGASTNITIIMNEGGNPDDRTAWQLSARILSGVTYAQFTDNTNFARLPIKFAPPPFTNINYSVTNYVTNAVLVADSFEDGQIASNVVYTTGDVVSGWLVNSGSVETYGSASTNAPLFTGPHTGMRFLDSNGDFGFISTNFPTIPGVDYLVSLYFARNPLTTNAGATVGVSSDGTLTNALARLPINQLGGPPGVWIPTSFVFQATSPTSTVYIASETYGSRGIFFDTFGVVQIEIRVAQGIYFQPEEPLSLFRGENAFGDWRLEVWDSRVGAAITNENILLAWRLNLSFVNTNPPVFQLTHTNAFCGTVGASQAVYFAVQVPLNAGAATNILGNPPASGGLDLIYNPVGVPIVTPGDVTFLSNRTEGVTVLSVRGWNSFDGTRTNFLDSGLDRLMPGQRYYLAVFNPNDTPANFCVRVDFDRVDPSLLIIRPLSNCVSGTLTNLYDYYRYDIVGSNAVQLSFTLSGLANDLGLVASPGFPLPNYNFPDYISDNPGLADERIDIVDFTRTNLLGRWHAAVYNTSGAGGPYQLCVTQVDASVTPLGPGGMATNTLPSDGVHYYTVNIFPNSCLASFCAYTTNAANLNVYVAPLRLDPVNGVPTNAVASAVGSNTCVTLSAFTQTNTLTPGLWVMAVVNTNAAAVDYYVQVAQFSDCAPYTELTNCMTFTDSFTNGLATNTYQFFVSNSAVQATFEVFGMNTNVDLYLNPVFGIPPPGPSNALLLSTNADLTPEFVVAVTNYGVATLQPGWWFLSVVSPSGDTNASYSVRACQITTNELRRLTQGTTCGTNMVLRPGDTNLPNSGVHFYTYNVPTGAVQVIFELINLTNNVDLFVQRSPPLTNFTTFFGADPPGLTSGTNFGAASEFVCVATNSANPSLGPGPWFVTVVNRDTNAARYCLRVSPLLSNNIVRLTDGTNACSDFPGLAAKNPASDVHYYAFDVATNAVMAFVEAYFVRTNRDVDIFVQRDLCFPNLTDPLATNYPYASTNLGTRSEWVCVATNSTPVPLTNGTWFVAVVNRSTNLGLSEMADYCIRTSQVYDTNITRLTNGMAQCVADTPGSLPVFVTEYYVFDVTNAAVQVVFETLQQVNSNLSMHVSYGPCFPDLARFQPGGYPYTSDHPGAVPEYVCVETNSAPVALTNGDWFVAVRRRLDFGGYCIRATQLLSNEIRRLDNNFSDCATVATNDGTGYSGVNFHVFRVPSNSLAMTWEITSTNGNVDAYLQYGLCFTNFPAYRGAVTNYPYVSTNLFTNASLSFYPYASTNGGLTNETICVIPASLPVPLQEGEWFLAVVNRDTNNVPVDYCVRVLGVNSNEVAELTNKTEFGTLTLEPTNSLAGSGIDYYHYRVATNAIQINVEVYGILNGNVDLYANRGPCWMQPQQFHYASTNLGDTNDCLFIATNSLVPLAGGDWYFAVVNPTNSGSVDYKIRIIEIYDTNVVRLASCVSITNSVELTNYVTGGHLAYYVVNVPTNAVQMWLEVTPLVNSTGVLNDVHAYLRRELVLPRNDDAHYYGTNSVMDPERFLVASNSVPTPLAPGFWFLTVENVTIPPLLPPPHAMITGRARYSVRLVSVATDNVLRLTNGAPYQTTLEPTNAAGCLDGVDYYVFRVSEDAVEVAFKIFNVDGDLDVYITDSPPLPSPTNNHPVVGPISLPFGAVSGHSTHSTNSTPPPLAPGDWYLAVHNRAGGQVNYSICATEYVIGASGPGGIIRLTNAIAYSNSVPPRGTVPLRERHHYVYTVSSNGVQANFETFGVVGGNVDLFLSHGVPLPDEFTTPPSLSGVNPGTAGELIVLATNSAPIPLAAGDWYLTVFNRAPVPVSYNVRVTEFIIDDGSGTNGLIAPLLGGAGNCVTTTNMGTNALRSPAIDYYAFTVTSGAVWAHFDLHGLDGDLALLVSSNLPLPSPTNFTAASDNPGLCDEWISLFANATNQFLLTTGTWYVAVVNTNPGPVRYTLCVDQFGEYGTNLRISQLRFENTTNLCLTWTNTLPGVNYYVQGKANLNVSNWTAISPTLRASANSLAWCTNFPTVWHFFRIKEGLAPKPSALPVTITAPQMAPYCGATLTWTAPTNQQFVIEWSPRLTYESWRSFTNIVSSTNGTFRFTDDCSQAITPVSPRFYRVLLYDP